MRYELIMDEVVNFIGLKRITEDEIESWIPIDEANTDYQEYLKWKAEQEG